MLCPYRCHLKCYANVHLLIQMPTNFNVIMIRFLFQKVEGGNIFCKEILFQIFMSSYHQFTNYLRLKD